MFSLLIVDDHKHLVENLATTIPWQAHGIGPVYQAFNGIEALARMAEHRIDIVVTDIRMPVMSGLDLIRDIRARYPGTDCVLLTGYGDFEYARTAIELQAARYLMKPVRSEELIRTIEELAEQRRERLQREAEHDRLRATVETELPRLRSDLVQAKADAAQSVEAERQRIAGDLHDIIGYTLTTSMVQLEAAKSELARGREDGVKRLDSIRSLMQAGRARIPQVIGIVQAGAVGDELSEAIERFAHDAEEAAGIVIQRRIALPMRISDPDTVKALMHALQEGITNGIRHGGATVFRLELGSTDPDGPIAFALWNDGRPYRGGGGEGHGLRAMRERIGGLGGQTAIAPTEQPPGTLLTVLLPAPEASA